MREMSSAPYYFPPIVMGIVVPLFCDYLIEMLRHYFEEVSHYFEVIILKKTFAVCVVKYYVYLFIFSFLNNERASLNNEKPSHVNAIVLQSNDLLSLLEMLSQNNGSITK